MKKLMLIAFAITLTLTACKKDVKRITEKPKTYFARIKQVDKDGHIHYSEIKAVTLPE